MGKGAGTRRGQAEHGGRTSARAAEGRRFGGVMSRPRFLADHDLNEHIIDGVLRREPVLEFIRARDVGLSSRPDSDILTFATENGLLIISHDVNTMPATAYARIDTGQSMPGLFMVRQSQAIAPVIESLVLIWSASEFEEWRNQVRFLRL